MSKRMLADVLWEAANVHLGHNNSWWSGPSRYTCDCIRYASASREERAQVDKFLRELGFPRDAEDRYDLFDHFEEGEERQGSRYMWLLLAMHVAEDEGIAL